MDYSTIFIHTKYMAKQRNVTEIDAAVQVLAEHVTGKATELEKMLNSQDIKLEEINGRVKQTNGRVKVLENWRFFIAGAVAVVIMMVVPLIVYVWNQQSSINRSVSQALDEKFNQYNIKVTP